MSTPLRCRLGLHDWLPSSYVYTPPFEVIDWRCTRCERVKETREFK